MNTAIQTEFTVQEDVVRVTIISPVAATVAKQLEMVMAKVHSAVQAGHSETVISGIVFNHRLHPKVVELLKEADITADLSRSGHFSFRW